MILNTDAVDIKLMNDNDFKSLSTFHKYTE
jgi:hypothetical protein